MYLQSAILVVEILGNLGAPGYLSFAIRGDFSLAAWHF